MIEVVSSPANLQDWEPDKQPFYLELYGETEPLVDEAYAQAVPAGSADPKATADAPVYEYWWTLGYPGQPQEHRHWFGAKGFGEKGFGEKEGKKPWQEIADPAARIYVYFPILAGWRAHEIVATLKYLSPVPEQHEWLRSVVDDFQAVQPLLSGASSVAGLIPGGGTASKWLSTVAGLQISNLPQSADLDWSVGMVTYGSKKGVMQGVMWTIPRTVFERLGGRLTGSVAVSFVPARRQTDSGQHQEGQDHAYRPAEILAHAVVYGTDEQSWWTPPGEDNDGTNCVELRISPQSPRKAVP